MKHVVLGIVTYICLATDAACGESLSIAGSRPPLMWLPVILAVTWLDGSAALAWGALIGLLADGLSAGRLGVEMLSVASASLLLSALRPDEDERSRIPWRVWQFGLLGSGLLLSRGLGSVLSDAPAVTLETLLAVAGQAIYGIVLITLFVAAAPKSESPRFANSL